MNRIIHGDCIDVMTRLPARSVDFILTDPPYLVNYRPFKNNAGQIVHNDNAADWLAPSFAQMHRVLKRDALCVSFYGWNKVDLFFAAWRAAGFRIAGHIVFRKSYASSAGFLRYHHESAYLLAKGDAPLPRNPVADVIEWRYTGNRLHPTQKPVSALTPLIASFTAPGALVLDPFCGSGSTLAAAQQLWRPYIGIELDPAHHATACRRLGHLPMRRAA